MTPLSTLTLHEPRCAIPNALPAAQTRWSAGLRWYSKLVVLSVFLLIFKGALVTSNDAGLSVPDWPTSYGHNMFLFPPDKWIGTIFYEHVHRLLASVVGLLTVVLAVWIWCVDARTWVRRLAAGAVFAVTLQGFLGGLTVLYRLPTLISASHAVLAQTFFLITIWLAYSQSRERETRARGTESALGDTVRRSLLTAVGVALAAVYLQLGIGAVMRHAGAGIAVLDFPTIAGSWWPQFDAALVAKVNAARAPWHLPLVGLFEVFIHLAHRIFGVVAVIAVWRAGVVVRRAGGLLAPRERRHATLVMALVMFQFLLGVSALLSLRSPVITSLHVLVGALLLGSVFMLMLRLAPVAKEG